MRVIDIILTSKVRHAVLYFIKQVQARAIRQENLPAIINIAADLERQERMP